MFFPWVGMYEQIRLADVFIDLLDVQFSKGSFSNRVQIKTSGGTRWLTIPLHNLHLGQKIYEVEMDGRSDWRHSHREMLSQSYREAPFLDEMMEVVDSVYSIETTSLHEFVFASLTQAARYFGLDSGREFRKSSDLPSGRHSSERVLDLCIASNATRYVTGHGARNYLDHGLFEMNNVRVEYMEYRMIPYRQGHGEFTPFVSILDLIANEGRGGLEKIQSPSVYWKNFIESHE